MSQEVDQRVVEMRFDNAKFEKNVQQSINSLNALNESLKFEGAEKGFAEVEKASEKVDFDRMTTALETLTGKFSALEVIGMTALVKITDKAIDAGAKLTKSLSIDQVMSGWNKYAQKTASVQTIMNATGKSITKVNGYLSKLMWFSDETSYSFTDMTQSLGQLTASGGDIEKVIPMIMGMANATAYAGKGASEFSRIIYNLNQSYSQGYLSLMDWKSVELAGVATAELKKQIIETGVELGKIKEGDVTVGTFSSTLSTKWADKEVMETAFGKFAEFSEAVKKMVDANPGMLASQAIDALADQYDEVTVKAFKAAQEAKSFSEAVDATKDAVSSGWMETFDILFGNYEEAKGFWSDLAEEFWNMFAGGAAGRNNWLKNAFDSGLDQLLGTEGFDEAGDNYINLLQKALVKQGLLSEEGIEEAGSFHKALEESGVTAQQLYEVLGEAAEYYHQRAAMSDEELDKLGFDRGKVDALANAYDSMAEQIQNGSVNLDDLAGKMNQLSGREHFFNGILNVLEGINSVLSPIRDGFGDVFMTDGSPLYNFLKGFDELTGKMALSEETAEKVQKVFTGVFRALSIGLKGVKTVGKTVFMILGKLLDLLSPMGDLLLNIGSYIGNLLTWVDESLGQAESLSDVLGILVGAVAALVSPIADVVKGVKTLVRGGSMEEAKKQFGAFGTVVDAVGSVLDKFKIDSVSAGNGIGTAFQLLGGILLGAFEGAGALIGRAFNGFKGAGDMVSEFSDSKVPLLENIRDVVLSLPEKAEKALADFGGTLTGIMIDISGACRNALSAVKDFFNLQDGVDLYRLLALIDVGALAAAIYGATVLLKKASDNFKKTLANPIGDFFNSLTGAVNTWTKANTTNNLATAAKAIATAVALISGSMYLLAKIDDPTRAVQALASVIAELFGMVVALKVLAATDLTGLDTAKLIGTVTAISIGMGLLAAAFAKMGSMHTYQVENGMKAISRVASVLMGMVGMLTVFNTYGDGAKGSGAFIAAAAAIDIMILAVEKIGGMHTYQVENGVKAISAMAVAMSVLLVAAGAAKNLAGKADVSTLDKIIKYLVKLGGMLVAINAIGAALLMAAGAVAIFASLGDRMMDGIRGAGLVVSGIAALLVLMANTKVNPLRMKKGAESMVIASASLLVMAAAVKQMGKAMETDTGGVGMAGVSLMLIELAGALYLLGKRAPESTAAAVAMVAMGAAMIEMALAIKMLADVDFADIAKSVFSLAAALGVLIAGCWGLGFVSANLASTAGACLMLATALLILTPAFKGLAGLTAGEAFAGVIGTIGIMLGLFAIGAITPVAAGMVVFSACLINLGKAFSAFAGGIIKLSIAAAILTVLSAFAGPLREVIVNAADDIEAALTAILTAICNTINNCAEPIGSALLTLCKVLIQTAINLIGWAWDGNGEGGGIKAALDDLWEQLKAWIGEKGSEVSKLVNPLDPTSWVDTFTAKDRAFGAILNGITDPFLAPFGTSLDDLGNQLENKMQGVGENLSQGFANGIEANTNVSDDASSDMGQQAVDAAAEAAGVASPSWKTFEIGSYMAQGLANGLAAPESFGAVTSAASALSNAVETNFRNFWGIHSPSTWMATLSEYIPEGFKEGLTGTDGTAAIGDGISGMLDSAGSWLDKLFPGLLNKAKNYGSQFQNELLSGSEYQGMPGFDEWYEKEISAYRAKQPGGKTGLTSEDLDEDIKKDPKDSKNPTGSGGKTRRSSGSGTKKTVAQQIKEKYKTRLEANKTLQSTIDQEYELWQAENQYSASEDELMAKKAAHAADAIKAQTERVSIAQEKYDALYSKWGAEKAETKSAYNELLEEKTSLAELKAKQYTDLFEEVAKRYDTNLDTLEKQYNLWSTDNDRTATKRDKILKEREYQTEELAVREKKEANAKEQYEKLSELYGESDLRTIEAYNEWLDAQTESLKVRNSIAEKQYELIEADIETIKDAQNLAASQMELLQKVYNDGDLSARADAYREAVETYGKDSEQARKARYQGTVSGILAAVSAVKSMNAQMEQTLQYEQLLEQAKKDKDQERIQSYNEQLLNSQTAFLGFAENLADALNLGDTGKQVTLKLAMAIQKNWTPLKEGFNTAMDKAFANNPELKNKLTDAFKTAFSETGMEVGTEFVSTIVAMMQGDWANALASGLNFMIDFLNTKMGQDLMTTVLPKITELFSNVGKAAKGAQIGQAMGEMGGEMAMVAEEGGGLIAVLQAVAGGIGEIGTAVAAFVAEFWPYILVAVAIIAVLAGIAALVNKHNGVDKVDKELAEKEKDSGADLDINFAWGINAKKDKVDDAVTAMTQNAVDIAASAAQSMENALNEDWDYTPTIRPVVDLTEVWDSAEDVNNAFAGEKPIELDSNLTARLAKDADRTYRNQNGNGADAQTGRDAELLNAVSRLGDHMDAVGESIRGMKVVMDGRKTVGYIDSQLGVRAERRR